MASPLPKLGLAVCAGLLYLAAVCGPVMASTAGSCPVWRAKADVAKARRVVDRAEARLIEAKRVLYWTKHYTRVYGLGVARWVRLARRAGFRWDQMPTVMFIINRESRGDPEARNPCSTASGLWQFLASWWEGKWDPFCPPASMDHAHKAVVDVGWSPWGVQ